jgi:predicted RND superfamily exporter protein
MAKSYSSAKRGLILLFDKIVLAYPGLVILCVLAAVVFLGFHAKDFKLDASAETLVLEHDEDLRYARLIESRYGERDFLVIAVRPHNELFAEETLAMLGRLRDDLQTLQSLSAVLSILDAPLLASPPVPVKELGSNIRTLESSSVDKALARKEFQQSPLYQDLLVSSDLRTTALFVYFPEDTVYRDLLERRNHLWQKKTAGSLTATERVQYKVALEKLEQHKDKMKRQRHRDIAAIRAIMDKYRSDADLFLGGVSMIADDMIAFIKNDLKVFGVGVLLFMTLTLGIIFKKIRWVSLPMLVCFASAVFMIGLLGWFGWKVTVISSNFISLQLIITIAITIHLIVRYRELLVRQPDADNRRLILDTIRLKIKPCVYAALTTIAGFGSLVLCDILPVVTFGWMMIAGLVISLVLAFLLFPAVLILLPKEIPPVRRRARFALTSILARFTEAHGTLILAVSGAALAFSAIGLSRLAVENSFINYFKDTTEIYQGMKLIDQNLGGTTPLDVVIDLQQPRAAPANHRVVDAENDDVFDEFDEFDKAATQEQYWFTREKMARVMQVHSYLESLPETGKVLSLATVLQIAKNLNHGEPLDNFELALLYKETPDKLRDMLIRPYVSVEHNQVRFSARVRDSERNLRRNELLKLIKAELKGKLQLDAKHIHLAGMLVLYNNMLQSLFHSQILTLGITVLALMGMFLVLFRSLKIALIAMFPNLLSIAVVLGVMGWLGIHLDMMTITIAAISVGIAVDNTIHYIHRFKQEFQVDRNYINTMHRCHGSIGHAMYYTSVTIIIGFSILTLSNFIPSIYFGLLTGLAMLIALLAALTLLPQMLVVVKPFGPQPQDTQHVGGT